MINQKIEIVSSSKIWLSSMGQESRDAILGVLTQHYASVKITIVDHASDLEALVARGPDLVFLGMKFIPSKYGKIWISQYLDEHDIAYTGSGQTAHDLELNKPLAKQRVLDAGLMTSPFFVVRQGKALDKDMSPSFPVFIKPTNRGGGLGIDGNSVAHNFKQLHSKVRSIARNHQSDSLIEEYLSGREFSVAILKNEDSAEFSVMPIELVAEPDAQGVRLLSEAVKSSNAERVLEVTDEIVRPKIATLALDVFHALGARDYGRIDIRLDEFGTPHFLEANLLPSLISGYGSFPKACLLNEGIDYETMILSITRLGLCRQAYTPPYGLEHSELSDFDVPYIEATPEPAI